jgi:hypothetical protein
VALRKRAGALNGPSSARFGSTGEAVWVQRFMVAKRPARRVQLGTVRRAGRCVLVGGAFLREPSSAGTRAESIGVEPVKERRVTRSFGLCRGCGARKAQELRKFSGEAFR